MTTTPVTMLEVYNLLKLMIDRDLIPARIDANRIKCRQSPLIVLPDHSAMMATARLIAGEDAAERVQDEGSTAMTIVDVSGFSLAHCSGVI